MPKKIINHKESSFLCVVYPYKVGCLNSKVLQVSMSEMLHLEGLIDMIINVVGWQIRLPLDKNTSHSSNLMK